MVISVSFVLLLGIVIFFLFRQGGLKWSHALICMAFGFWLSYTTVAPSINSTGKSLANLIGGIHF